MAIIIRNACLLDPDRRDARPGELRIVGGTIAATGPRVDVADGDEVVDAGGAVVMPGLVNGHTHLYSALAVGMPPPTGAPRGLHEILEAVWWRLDRALDLPLCETSAAIGGLDALHCGTTTVIDHHASPAAIEGSLDAIEAGLRAAGLRGVLCYETTDRNGPDGCRAGLAENERYLRHCRGSDAPRAPDASSGDGWFAALVGAHAAFTLSDASLAAVADLAVRYQVGVHIHVAEDPCDDTLCRQQYGAGVMDRLARAGVLDLPSLLAHGTHLAPSDWDRLADSPITLAHNPRSNMNNAVGYTPLAAVRRPIVLGTDGIGSDMLAELATGWYKSRDGGAGLAPDALVDMLAESARLAGRRLGVRLGTLAVGAVADVLVTDYVPATPLDGGNLAGHLIFALAARHTRSVMIGGQWRLRHRVWTGGDESELRRRSTDEARRLWSRMAEG